MQNLGWVKSIETNFETGWDTSGRIKEELSKIEGIFILRESFIDLNLPMTVFKRRRIKLRYYSI